MRTCGRVQTLTAECALRRPGAPRHGQGTVRSVFVVCPCTQAPAHTGWDFSRTGEQTLSDGFVACCVFLCNVQRIYFHAGVRRLPAGKQILSLPYAFRLSYSACPFSRVRMPQGYVLFPPRQPRSAHPEAFPAGSQLILPPNHGFQGTCCLPLAPSPDICLLSIFCYFF